jgi:hypothetical protein
VLQLLRAGCMPDGAASAAGAAVVDNDDGAAAAATAAAGREILVQATGAEPAVDEDLAACGGGDGDGDGGGGGGGDGDGDGGGDGEDYANEEALLDAAEAGDLSQIRTILAGGRVGVNWQHPELFGETALHRACDGGQAEAAALLLQVRARVPRRWWCVCATVGG